MKLKKLIKSRETKNKILSFFKFIPDKTYLKIIFRLKMHRKLDLKNLKTFNEKLQWLKLYDRKPIYTTMVDKYEAKKYVADIIGEEYIIPTLGVWDKFDEIDFDKLPNQFVLKCTHDSGGLVICKDKSQLNIKEAKKKIEKSLKCNFYWVGREWPYKNVKPRIIAEEYMKDSDSDEMKDYKIYTFNGNPNFLYLSQGLSNHSTARISFVTFNWEKAKYRRNDYQEFEHLPPKPNKLEQMINLSKVLAKDISFCRVDFYEVNHNLYFSEITFFPGSGFTPLINENDIEMGELLNI